MKKPIMKETTRKILKDGFRYLKNRRPRIAASLFEEALRTESSEIVKYAVALGYGKAGKGTEEYGLLSRLDSKKARRRLMRVKESVFDPLKLIGKKPSKINPPPDADANRRNLSGKIWGLLKRCDKTLDELAQMSGVHRMTVYRMLHGSSNLQTSSIKKICGALAKIGGTVEEVNEIRELLTA